MSCFFATKCWLLLHPIQGTIVHALEKTKYEDSDTKWKELDLKYHFWCQFTASNPGYGRTNEQLLVPSPICLFREGTFDVIHFSSCICGQGISCQLEETNHFSMARLDKIKNISGLTECYGKNKRLRSLANLVVVTGFFDLVKSEDREETAEMKRMHSLIENYQLKVQMDSSSNRQMSERSTSPLYCRYAGSLCAAYTIWRVRSNSCRSTEMCIAHVRD